MIINLIRKLGLVVLTLGVAVVAWITAASFVDRNTSVVPVPNAPRPVLIAGLAIAIAGFAMVQSRRVIEALRRQREALERRRVEYESAAAAREPATGAPPIRPHAGSRITPIATNPSPHDQEYRGVDVQLRAALLGMSSIPLLLVAAVFGAWLDGGAGALIAACMGLLPLMFGYQAVLDAGRKHGAKEAPAGSDPTNKPDPTRRVPWIVAGSAATTAAALFLLGLSICGGRI